MRLIRRFFVTITAAFIMFSAGHTASNAADRYYTASKPGAAACVLTYHFCNKDYYLENGMCKKCPTNFTSTDLNDGGITSCKIKLDPGKYYSVDIGIFTCPEGYYCKGGEQYFVENNQYIGRSECPAGSFCPQGSSEPTPCDAGYYCPYTKQSDKTTAQLECGTGNYCIAGSAEPTQCPDVPDSTSVNTWLKDVITDKQICNTADNIKHKQEPAFVSYKTKVGAVTDCQIKLEVNIPCGLVHIYHILYDPGKGTYSDTKELTSYYISLNQGYYLHERLYHDHADKCKNTDTSDDALPLYYSQSSPCDDDVINYCYGLPKMPANCQEYNDYPETFGIFKCEAGQYKSDTSDPTSIFPNFVECPIGSYCEKCQIYTCPSRYYCPTTGLTETTYQNYKCPTGATSNPGSKKITDCYLNNATIFQDKNGTFSLPMTNINIIATGK